MAATESRDEPSWLVSSCMQCLKHELAATCSCSCISCIFEIHRKIYKINRNILKAPSKTSKEMLFLELWFIPLRLIIRNKRINFVHYILNQPSDSILNKVCVDQVKSPNRNDWIKLIEQDIEVLGIEPSYDEIKNKKNLKTFSKTSFKRRQMKQPLHILIN